MLDYLDRNRFDEAQTSAIIDVILMTRYTILSLPVAGATQVPPEARNGVMPVVSHRCLWTFRSDAKQWLTRTRQRLFT